MYWEALAGWQGLALHSQALQQGLHGRLLQAGAGGGALACLACLGPDPFDPRRDPLSVLSIEAFRNFHDRLNSESSHLAAP